MSIKNILSDIYSKNSKHSNYQILSRRLAQIVGDENISVKTRFELERFEYINKKIDFKNKSVLDIGGNTGFFSFEFLDVGAKNIQYYEGNKAHAEFVEVASKYLNLNKNINVINEYFIPEKYSGIKYDITLLLNVLHHFGDDYGNKDITIDEVKKNILFQLKSFKKISNVVVFQLGFNWKGDINSCLFENGTKKEMIEFIRFGIEDCWDIDEIGIAEKVNGIVSYCDLNEHNIERDDSLGEFLNRPLFILKAK